MNRKKQKIILVLTLFIVFALTGCKKQTNTDILDWKYDEKSVTLKTDSINTLYSDFNVVLLNESKEIVFLKEYSNEYISNTNPIIIKISDVKPEYIKEEKVNFIEISDIAVNEIDNNIFISIVSLCMAVVIFLLKICLFLKEVWL